jgi:hypothetical protein
MLIILQLFHCNKCDIKPGLILDVIRTSHFLLLFKELMIPCLKHFESHLLSAKNAFSFFTVACDVNSKEFQPCAIYAMSGCVCRAALLDSRGLHTLTGQNLQLILGNPILKEFDKWLVMMHWLALQYLGQFTALEDFKLLLHRLMEPKLTLLRQDVEVFIKWINIFNIPTLQLREYVLPVRDLLPSFLQRQLDSILWSCMQNHSLPEQRREYNVGSTIFPNLEAFTLFQICIENQMKALGMDADSLKCIRHSGWRFKYKYQRAPWSFKNLRLMTGDILLLKLEDEDTKVQGGAIGDSNAAESVEIGRVGLYLCGEDFTFLFKTEVPNGGLTKPSLCTFLPKPGFPLETISTCRRHHKIGETQKSHDGLDSNASTIDTDLAFSCGRDLQIILEDGDWEPYFMSNLGHLFHGEVASLTRKVSYRVSGIEVYSLMRSDQQEMPTSSEADVSVVDSGYEHENVN